jgi:hypothetical protein
VALIAVRHTDEQLAARLAPELFEKCRALLTASLLSTWQTLDTFQAALILAMWSTTVGQTPLSIDSWMISGFAIQHAISSDLFTPVLQPVSATNTESLSLLKLWNHLLLVHLHYAVGTRRRSMVGKAEVDLCQRILAFDTATNFEFRMVAEVNLYWLLYDTCCRGQFEVPTFQAAIKHWRQSWQLILGRASTLVIKRLTLNLV